MTALGIRYLAFPHLRGLRSDSDFDHRDWPPAPARVFVAIAATYFARADELERQALQWLEHAGTPAVSAANEGYIRLNGACADHPTTAIIPSSFNEKAIYLLWDSEMPPHLRPALQRLCERVDCIGQPASPVQMWIADWPEVESEAGSGDALFSNRQVVRDARIERTLKILNGSFSDPALNLGGLSRSVGISEAHLGRVFRKSTGLPFRQYLRNLRIDRAAALLLSSNDRVKAIAFAVGYRSQAHFGRDFRACFGRSPQSFRELGRSNGTLSRPGLAKAAASNSL